MDKEVNDTFGKSEKVDWSQLTDGKNVVEETEIEKIVWYYLNQLPAWPSIYRKELFDNIVKGISKDIVASKQVNDMAFGEWCLKAINVVYDRPHTNEVFGYQRKGGDGLILNIEDLYIIFKEKQLKQK